MIYRNSLKQHNYNRMPVNLQGKIQLRINDSIDTSMPPVTDEDDQNK